jgi:DNA replication and repair protein RecF
MFSLRRLRLTDFRNYAKLGWEPCAGAAGRISVITGANGSGKTNILEAISLLVPGRGLRGAATAEFARRGPDGTASVWGIAGQLETPDGPVAIGTGSGESTDRRVFRIDGTIPRSHADVAARIAIVWLTPQMDVLFQEPASGRRRFLDRLVYALEPAHARQIAAHDTAQAQRSRLLALGGADPSWLGALEESIARHAVAATAARKLLVRRLNRALDQGAAAGFPQARLTLLCPIGAQLDASSALGTEDWLRNALAASRGEDARGGSAGYGAQRADMRISDARTGTEADRASTGERKSLLIGVILGHAALIGAVRGAAPILLLDEPMVHLDASRRLLLCAALQALPAQCVLTGTDAESFSALAGTAGFFRVESDRLHASPKR